MDIVKHSMGGVGGGADHSNSNSNSSSKNNNNNKLYKGVRLRKWGKWVSEIRLPNSRERIWLGSYDSAEKAARAFDAALYCLRGPHASFNFPNTPFDLDINVPSQSLTPQQILQIAQTFANKKHHINHLPTHENSQQQQEEEQQQQPSLLTCTSATATSSSTQSSMNNIDWTFLNVLDDQSSNAVAVGSSSSDDHCGLFSNLDKIHSGDFTYSTPFYEEQIEADIDIDDDNDPFSHQYSSFLWGWDF